MEISSKWLTAYTQRKTTSITIIIHRLVTWPTIKWNCLLQHLIYSRYIISIIVIIIMVILVIIISHGLYTCANSSSAENVKENIENDILLAASKSVHYFGFQCFKKRIIIIRMMMMMIIPQFIIHCHFIRWSIRYFSTIIP